MAFSQTLFYKHIFIKNSANNQHMDELKVVLGTYWHDATPVKKSLESKF